MVSYAAVLNDKASMFCLKNFEEIDLPVCNLIGIDLGIYMKKGPK
jgi:hypothetical protein